VRNGTEKFSAAIRMTGGEETFKRTENLIKKLRVKFN
jgi:hypothetical protein